MSRHRENVIWRSDDGSWNRGFFSCSVIGADEEWDVEYDFNSFEWVRTGMSSVDEAWECWEGDDPRAAEVLTRHPSTHKARSRYDEMAKACCVR